MQCKVVTVKRQKGIGAKSGKPYDFQSVGALIQTKDGTEFAEFMLDGDAPTPESGKTYDMEISVYPDREKRLAFRVNGLRPAVAPAVKVA